MRSRIGLVLGVAFLVIAPAAPASYAQQPPAPVERLSFDDAVRRGIERSYSVSAAAQGILRAEALLQQAGAVFRPTLEGSLVTTVLDSQRGFQGQVTQPQTQSSLGATLGYPVLAASRWAARTQAQDQVGVARISRDELRRQVAIAVGEAYLEIIAQQRQVEVRLRAVETARALLDYARARLEGGVGSRLNELRAAQELATGEALLEGARFGVRRAQEALGVLVVSDGPVDAAGEPSFEVPSAIGEEWLRERTDVRFFSAQLGAAERIVRDSWRDWVPTATAAFDPQYLTPSGLFQPSRTWRAFVQLGVPVLDGGTRRALRRQRETARETARLQLDERQLAARAELRTAQASLESTELALTSARLAAQHANEVVRISDIAFRAGATTNIEVVDAQQRARNTEIAAAEAEDRVRRSRLDVLVALGRFPG